MSNMNKKIACLTLVILCCAPLVGNENIHSKEFSANSNSSDLLREGSSGGGPRVEIDYKKKLIWLESIGINGAGGIYS